MIERVPAEPSHLAVIFANQSDQMKADVAAVRQEHPTVSSAQMEAYFASTLPDPDAETALLDGVPSGTIGWDKNDPDVWYSWSATSPDAYDPKRPVFVLLQRRFFREVAERNPGVRLRMRPLLEVSDQMVNWMGLLGFEYCECNGHFEHSGALDNARQVGYLE